MSDKELMNMTESELTELINNTKRKIEKLKLENLKKKIIINETVNNS